MLKTKIVILYASACRSFPDVSDSNHKLELRWTKREEFEENLLFTF